MGALALFGGKWLVGLGFLAGAAVMALPLVTGGGLGSFADAQRAVEFVRNPAGAIVDEVSDRIFGDDDEPSKTRVAADEPVSTFDADEVFARYQARLGLGSADAFGEPASPPAVPAPGAGPARPVFGRKQA